MSNSDKPEAVDANKTVELKDTDLEKVSGGAFVNAGVTRADIFSGQGGGSGTVADIFSGQGGGSGRPVGGGGSGQT